MAHMKTDNADKEIEVLCVMRNNGSVLSKWERDDMSIRISAVQSVTFNVVLVWYCLTKVYESVQIAPAFQQQQGVEFGDVPVSYLSK